MIYPLFTNAPVDTGATGHCTADDQVPVDPVPFCRVASGCTSRSRLLLSHLRRLSKLSRRRNICRTWARDSTGQGSASVFTLSHVACSIRPITGQLLLFPTSQCRPSIGLPYGWLARRRGAWRSGDLSTFHVIALADDLGGAWTPVTKRSRAGTLETCNLTTHANTGKHAFDLLTPLGLSRG
jgi:hypothetical protein